MGQLDSVVFGEKRFSDILEEIYNNQKKKEAQVTALISELINEYFSNLEFFIIL